MKLVSDDNGFTQYGQYISAVRWYMVVNLVGTDRE